MRAAIIVTALLVQLAALGSTVPLPAKDMDEDSDKGGPVSFCRTFAMDQSSIRVLDGEPLKNAHKLTSCTSRWVLECIAFRWQTKLHSDGRFWILFSRNRRARDVRG